MRRSVDISVKPARIVCKAPLAFNVFNSNNAPKTMSKISNALTTPLTKAPPIWLASVPQTKKANATVTTNANGIARDAGQFKTTRNIKTTIIGVKASKANNPKLTKRPPLTYLIVY